MNKIKLLILLIGVVLFFSITKSSEAAYSCGQADSEYNYSWTESHCANNESNNTKYCTSTDKKYDTVKTGACSLKSGYSSCGGSRSRCGRYLTLTTKCYTADRNDDGKITGSECWEKDISEWSSGGCTCRGTVSCKKTFTSCSGRCGYWPQNCGRDDKNCGRCSSGYSCVSGNCKKDAVCNEITCGKNDCGPQAKKCGSGTISCGNCAAGYSCKGKNANGNNGSCVKDPVDTYSINVLVFYDKYGSGLKKGSEPAYNLCYPATSTGGAGNASGDVTISINGKNYTRKMYKNCRSDGKTTTSTRGFKITGLKKKTNSVKLIIPNGAAYDVIGYNYTKEGSGGTKVVTTGSQAQLRQTPVIEGNFTVRFGVEKVTKTTPPAQVSGFVFIDNNENGRFEPDDNDETVCYKKDVNIKVGTTDNAFTSKADCSPFSFDKPGTQTVSLNPIPTGFVATGLEYIDANNPSDANDDFNLGPIGSSSISLTGESEVHFGIKPQDQIFTISGNIYLDSTTPKKKTSGETNYTGATATNRTVTITNDQGAAQGTAVQPTTGAGYTTAGIDLTAGTYTVTYGGPPTGYITTYPATAPGVDPSFTITLGDECDTSTINDATCDANGNITNLNFGINNAAGNPWYQTVGANLRNDSANSNKIPASGTCSYTTQYASANRSANSDAGLVFNSSSSVDLGATGSQNPRANPNGRLITGKKFKPARGGGIRTAYSYLNSVATRGGQTPKSLFSGGNNTNYPCTGTKPDCTFPATNTSTFVSGVYTSNGGLNFNGTGTYTFQNNKKYVFLVSGGDIRINRNITVDPGSSVAFISSGNIIISPGVTEIAGIFSANKNFVVEDSAGNAPLTVNGSVVANAGYTSGAAAGKFDNQRSNLTGTDGDSVCPSVRIVANPGMMLNAPSAMKIPTYSVAEVAPGPISSSVGGVLPTVTPTNTPTPTPTPLPTNTPTPTPTPTLATGYAFSGGAVTIDAEASSPLATKIGRSSRDWTFKTSPLAYTGTGYISALPDSGTNLQFNLPTTAAEVKYNVCFPAAGRYWIWTRGSAPDSAGDAIAYGIDGVVPASANPYMLYIKDVDGSSDWQWRGKIDDGSKAYVDVATAGFHNLNLYMRNDGARVDKIYLVDSSTSPSFAGTSGNGNAASGSTTCADNR